MKNCTYRLSLDELLNRPGLLALRGSDGENEPGDQDEDANKGDEDEESEESGEDGKNKSKGKKAEPDAKDKRISALEEEKQRFYDQREDVKKQLKTANAEIAKLKKDGTPDDALKSANEDLTRENAKLTSANQALMLENAFLKEVGFDWVDPDAALKLADLSKVEYDEEQGKAIGLNTALTDLAKAKPYLLKPKADDKNDDEEKGDKKRRTGTTPRPGSQKKADQAAREAQLRQKYSALRR